jgi:hypothetical protein
MGILEQMAGRNGCKQVCSREVGGRKCVPLLHHANPIFFLHQNPFRKDVDEIFAEARRPDKSDEEDVFGAIDLDKCDNFEKT